MKQRNAERVISGALIALGFDEKIRAAAAYGEMFALLVYCWRRSAFEARIWTRRARISAGWSVICAFTLRDEVAERLIGFVTAHMPCESVALKRPISFLFRISETRAETHKIHHTITATRQMEARKFLASLS